MTSVMPSFRLQRPVSVAEAVAALSATPGVRPLAGGTDLLVNLRRGLGAPSTLVDLTAICGLDQIDVGPDGLVIGATVALARLAEEPAVRAGWPALAQAAAVVAGPTHREAATLAGNLCQDTRCVFVNQSEWWRAANGFCLKVQGDTCHVVKKSERCYAVYAGDVAPALLVLGATVEVAGRDGVRRMPLADLFREEGRTHLALEPGAIVTAVRVPPADGFLAGYVKVRVRDSIDFPLAGIAMALRRSGDGLASLRVALTGIASAPVLVPDLDTMLGRPWAEIAGPLAEAVRKACNAVKTTVATPKYRRRVSAAAAVALGAKLWAAQETETGS